MNVVSLIEVKPNTNLPAIAPGDTVKVSIKVVEGDKERTQVLRGVVIRVRHGAAASFTVRRVSYGVGVERTFPFNSPRLEKVEVVRHGKIRRARLYYLRGLSARASRIKEKRMDAEKAMEQVPSTVAAEPEQTPQPEQS